ncbi:nickel pincer cofactor biosynthesis protein LarC [Actinomycetospora cinnamomea]|uniref:Pyridinium-3,5-bisthiocarboxylic acid mononucleotide nickel insertion protein n=1 Tax=Actinomycetospora cinnamomea TaxID=663609 RepID=A0A2U1F402_9PSEU|nr:nickel pincer cofactor biosynthesis protein LarC [Actinomycetospora cinnamomea]PVZ06901.1 hypothetical protein C8D89_11294 [Actinomycetospora cinnamomea]
MPDTAYVDATAGAAGDMLLGALLDAGADLERVRDAVDSLGIPGLGLDVVRERRGGFGCLRAVVTSPEAPDRERRLPDVLDHVRQARLDPAARRLAQDVFTLLARAEAAVHGVVPEEVHFHEVGAFDALADVVGVAAAAASLGLLEEGAATWCSPLAVGHGTVRSAHGRLPVPAPAVLRIAADAGLEITGGDLEGERTTPTGAALLAALATPGPLPAQRVTAVGVGGGRRDPADRPNVTRVVLGHAAGAPGRRGHDEVLVVEATVDDLDPRLWPSVLAAVRVAGAWDCWTTPVVGRHGRPGQVLSALCAETVREAVVEAVFRHTSTFGVRWSRWERATARRRAVRVEVGPPGSAQEVTVKVADDPDAPGGLPVATPELSEAEAAASALGWPVRTVVEAALAAYRRGR